MLEEDLIALVKKIEKGKYESQSIEIKTAEFGCPKLYDTLSSFSNQNSGGVILFGISEKNDFTLTGVYDSQDLQKKVTEQCNQMEPSIRSVFTICTINGKQIVSAEIPPVEVSRRPVFYKGMGRIKGSYIRVGEADEPMSEYEIYSYDAFKKQIKDDVRVADIDMSNIDERALNNYLYEVQKDRPNTTSLSNDELITLMGLEKDGKPTLTSIMCFSKYPQAIFPQLCITAVVVPGTSMGDESKDGQRFLANKKIEGTIPQMVEEAVNFVSRNMKIGVSIKDGKRKDIPEYPLTAIREVILNALVHRDYSIYTEGSPIRIEMYTDRIEITNAGGLYGAVDIDNLGRIRADTRNKTLVSVLEKLKVIENRFSGIPTIRKELKSAKLPDPIFIERKGFFTVIFYNKLGKPTTHNIQRTEEDLISFCEIERTRFEIAEFLGKTQYYAMKTYIEPLISKGLLKYTDLENIKSKNNKIIKV